MNKEDIEENNELRFGNCPELKEINCYGKGLTVLNIKSAPVLKELYCSNNQLTASA